MIQPTDSELLMRFTRSRDDGAFRSLVERHARLVRTVCRRILGNEHDVEDACQATFMVLARRASSIRSRDSVASWLFKVAYRIALRAARSSERAREQPVQEELRVPSRTLSRLQERETFETLAAELDRLPERYRLPIVLFYLEGRSRHDTAEELDCSEATVKGRLARGRRLLRHRLIRRGVSLALVVQAWDGTSATAAGTQIPALERAVSAGLEYARSGKPGPGCSARSVSLAEGVQPMTSLSLTKTGLAAGVIAAAGLITAGTLGPYLSAGQSEANPAESGGTAVESTLAPDAGGVPVSGTPAVAVGAARSQDASAGSESRAGAAETADRIVVVDRATKSEDKSAPPDRETGVDLKARSPAEQEIEEALDEETAVEFIDTPLQEAMIFMADLAGINIILDEQALEEEGISTDEPINRVLSRVTLDSALNIILEPLDLTYIIEDDVMKITTQKRAREKPEPRLYRVQRLVDAGIERENLEGVIKQQNEEADVEMLPGFLAIRQSQPRHRKLVELIELLHKAIAAQQTSGREKPQNGDRASSPKSAGIIRRVDHDNGVAWINLGEADGLSKRTTLAVYEKARDGAVRGDAKGSIEVTHILGPHLAEARIRNSHSKRPIAVGDTIQRR